MKMRINKIVLLFIIGFMLRIIWVWILPYPSYPVKIDDAYQYDTMARNLLGGNGFSQKSEAPFESTICRTPGYPFFLAAIYRIFGRSFTAVYLIQALISSLTALLLYGIVLKFLQSNKHNVSFLAYILAIFCPFLWFSARMLYTEVLFSFFVVLIVFLNLCALEKNHYARYFILGLALALSMLIRPVLSLLPLFLALIMVLAREKSDNISIIVKRIVVLFCSIVIFMAPWAVRNYIIFDKFIPLSVASGSYMYLGTFSPNRYDKDFPIDMHEWDSYLGKEGKEILALDDTYKKKALKRIQEKPMTFIKYGLQRIPILWVSSFSQFYNFESTPSQLVAQMKGKILQHENFSKEFLLLLAKSFLIFLNLFYLFVAFIGIVLSIKKWRKFYPLLLIPAYFTLAHMFLGQANARYCLPAWPILIIFSAIGICAIFERFKSKHIINTICH